MTMNVSSGWVHDLMGEAAQRVSSELFGIKGTPYTLRFA